MSDASATGTAIAFALVSHTNAGKTTLARTLVGRDIGEVRDAPHVTEVAESHELIATEQGDVLRLWDTPGFGDTARLVRRLQVADNPLGWLLREMWDRYRDRPLWCSQQAVRAARESADLVLYLVNAAEDPRDAGYVASEMQILRWVGRPVIVLLNQMGPPRPAAEEQAEVQRWREHLAPLGLVGDVLPLDAFARCWVQDVVLFDAAAHALPAVQQPGFARLRARWLARGVERFADAQRLLAAALMRAARDSEAVPRRPADGVRKLLQAVGVGRGDAEQAREQAMAALATRLDRDTRETTDALIALHGLHGSAAQTVLERLRANYTAREPVDETRSALLGSALTGALTGLKADLASGGLSFGAGMLVGGIVGGLAGAGLARGVNLLRGEPVVRWSDDFLDGLARSSLLRYLAIAHFGRGRGRFVEGEAPPFWQHEVAQVVAARAAEWHALWEAARSAEDADHAQADLAATLADSARELLARLYPDSAERAFAGGPSPAV